MNAKQHGHLFVFEGPDGVGKTSLAKATVDVLKKHSVRCEYLAFPGRTQGTLGHHVYELHHDRTMFDVKALGSTALQALHIAAHIDAIEKQIKPLIDSGISVILDRYWWSTLVYGRVGGANMQTLKMLVDGEIAHWGNLKPSQIFLIVRNESISENSDGKWKKILRTYKKLYVEREHEVNSAIIPNEGEFEETLSIVINMISEQIDRHPLNTDSAFRKQEINSNAVINSRNLITTFSPLSPAVTTKVYDTYWHFAAERQQIFFNRFEEKEQPWTDDIILSNYKFTNAYRASDRVSQYLIRNVIYKGDQSRDEVFFRIILFKVFNKISTWEMLVNALGEIRYDNYANIEYDKIITDAMSRGESVFSAAYIMPSGSSTFGETKKHRNFLKLIDKMMLEDVPNRISNCKRMRDAFEILLSYPTIGDFLAYQLVTDVNYSCITNFTEMEFVMPGPGAKSGIRKCFETTGGLNDADLIRKVTEAQASEFERRGITFKSLWGRQLQLIDCQNLFCEVDKYARIAHPEIIGLGGRIQIKQKFETGDTTPISYWYPPKWKINEKISKGSEPNVI